MTTLTAFRKVSTSIALAGLTCFAIQAQWSILAPGTRQAAPGKYRYAYFVFANPVPGREVEFNDWYSNTHMGDYLQQKGFTGAQRFRIVTDVNPKPSAAGYTQGYLIIWDWEDADINGPFSRLSTAPVTGKVRRSPAWGFAGSPQGAYLVMGPRITRPDGRGATMPTDDKTIRPNRYILMDFSNPLPGKEAEFDTAVNQRIKDVLTLPGWMAAQRYVLGDRPGQAGQLPKPRYLTIWETEGESAQAVNTTLTQAQKSGAVKTNTGADPATAEIVYWEPISPYVTRDLFAR
jgi:hypothetical protein